MGLGTNESKNYLVVKGNQFFKYSDKERKTGYDYLEGTLVDMYFREETYNGKEVEKMYFTISTDEGEEYTMNLRINSGEYTNFIGFLKNAEIKSPIKITTKEDILEVDKEGKPTKTKRSWFIKQDGENLKSFYRKGGGNELPEWTEVKVGNKMITDRSEYEDTLKAAANEIISKIGSSVKLQPQPKSEPETFVPQDDDLPF